MNTLVDTDNYISDKESISCQARICWGWAVNQRKWVKDEGVRGELVKPSSPPVKLIKRASINSYLLYF